MSAQVFKASPVVPEGVYRIRTADRANPRLYLEWTANGDIKPLDLKENNPNQQWTVAWQGDGNYRITNVASALAMSILPYEENGQKKYRLGSGGQQFWTLDPRGEEFIIGDPDNAFVVDIATNNWAILWERYNARNQRWILERESPTTTANPTTALPSPGSGQSAYVSIRNVSGGGFLYTNKDDRVVFANGAADYNKYTAGNRPPVWLVTSDTVSPGATAYNSAHDAYQIYWPHSSSPCSWLWEWVPVPGQSDDVKCATLPKLCRIVKAKGSQRFFNIILGTTKDSKALTGGGTKALSVDLDPSDTRQQWEFIPWNR